MHLHDDAVLLVHLGTGNEQVGDVGVPLLLRDFFPGHRLFEGGGGEVRIVNKRHIVKPVVGRTAAHRDKERQPLFKRFDNAVRTGELAADGLLELVDVFHKAGLVDVEGLVGAEGRGYDDLDRGVFGNLLVPFQGVNGVVGRADHRDVALADQAADRHVRVVLQFVVAEVPDFFGRIGVEHTLIPEVFLEFQVAPGVHRVADRHFQRFGKLLEPLAVGFVAGDIVFRHAVGAHDPPFIMVAEVGNRPVGGHLAAAEPDLGDVFKPAVLVNFLRRDMAVVVDDGQAGRVVMIQAAGGGGIEQEVLVHKRFHTQSPFHRRAQRADPARRRGRQTVVYAFIIPIAAPPNKLQKLPKVRKKPPNFSNDPCATSQKPFSRPALCKIRAF